MTSRRTFLKASASVALIPLINLDIKPASAAEKVNPESAAAKRLAYVHDATTAERTERAGVAGSEQICGNCQYYGLGGSVEGDWATCPLLMNGLVAKAGWCNMWMPKAS